MRSLIGLFTIGCLCVFFGACAESSKDESLAHRASSSAARGTQPSGVLPSESPSSHLKGDEDDDDAASGRVGNNNNDNDADSDNDSKAAENQSYHDSDDSSIDSYGHSASNADRRAIVAVVERYNAAAIAEDGVSACALMYSLFANNVPLDYGSGAGPAYSRGNTCPVVMAKLFKHYHGTLVAAAVITGVRVYGDLARALIGSKTTPASYFPLKQEGGVWKVDCLLAISLP